MYLPSALTVVQRVELGLLALAKYEGDLRLGYVRSLILGLRQDVTNQHYFYRLAKANRGSVAQNMHSTTVICDAAHLQAAHMKAYNTNLGLMVELGVAATNDDTF